MAARFFLFFPDLREGIEVIVVDRNDGRVRSPPLINRPLIIIMPDLFLDLGKYERGYHEQKKSEEIKKRAGLIGQQAPIGRSPDAAPAWLQPAKPQSFVPWQAWTEDTVSTRSTGSCLPSGSHRRAEKRVGYLLEAGDQSTLQSSMIERGLNVRHIGTAWNRATASQVHKSLRYVGSSRSYHGFQHRQCSHLTFALSGVPSKNGGSTGIGCLTRAQSDGRCNYGCTQPRGRGRGVVASIGK